MDEAEVLKLTQTKDAVYINGFKIMDLTEWFSCKITFNDLVALYEARLWAEFNQATPFLLET